MNTVGLFLSPIKIFWQCFKRNEKKNYWILYTWVHAQRENVWWKTGTTFTHTLRHVKCSSHTLTLCPHSPITKSLSIMALICVHLTCLSLNIHQQSFIIQFLVFFFLLFSLVFWLSSFLFVFFFFFLFLSSNVYFHFQHNQKCVCNTRSFSIFCCYPLWKF